MTGDAYRIAVTQIGVGICQREAFTAESPLAAEHRHADNWNARYCMSPGRYISRLYRVGNRRPLLTIA